MTEDAVTDGISADYLAGHPDAPDAAPDGRLRVADGALTFSGSVLRGMTMVDVGFAVPLGAVRAVSVLDRGMAEAARPVLLAGAAAGALGVFMSASRPLRDRLLLVDPGDGSIVAFAVTALGAARLRAALDAVRPDLAAASPAGGDAVLAEIRDLLARQVELLERIAGRLAP